MNQQQLKGNDTHQRRLRTNLFKIEFTKPIFKYQISISPEIELQSGTSIYKIIFKQILKLLDAPIIYIKQTIYSPQELQSQQLQLIVQLMDQQYEVTLTPNSILKTNEEKVPLMQKVIPFLLDAIDYHKPDIFSNYFCNPMHMPDVEQKMQQPNLQNIQQWLGFHVFINQFQGENYLQIQPRMLSFPNTSCLSLIKQMLNRNYGKDDIKQFLYNKIVKTNYYSKCLYYRVLDIDFTKNPLSLFNIDEPIQQIPQNSLDQLEQQTQKQTKSISYKDYFLQKYNVRVLEADYEQPLLLVQRDKKHPPVYLISQFCNIILDNMVEKNYKVFSNIIVPYNDSAQAAQDLQKLIRVLTFTEKFQQQLDLWHLKINLDQPQMPNFIYLDPGQIQFKNNVFQSLADIVYPLKINDFDHFYGQTFKNSFDQFPKLDKWVALIHQEDMTPADKMISCMSQFQDYYGYDLQRPTYEKLLSLKEDDWLQQIDNHTKNGNQFLLIIMHEKMDTHAFYKKIKEFSTLNKGVCCQIITAKTLRQYEQQMHLMPILCTRILAQIAAKLGFAPWRLKEIPFQDKPTIIFGINVQKASFHKNLIVSIVCSMNKSFSKYMSTFYVQGSNKQISIQQNTEQVPNIIDSSSDANSQTTQQQMNDNKPLSDIIQDLVKTCIQKFCQVHKLKYIENVIVLRDGLYSNKTANEIQNIKAVLAQISSNQQPNNFKLIYITSKQVSNTFMYQQNFTEYVNSNTVRNVGMGTLVATQNDQKEFLIYIKKEDKGCFYPNYFRVLVTDGEPPQTKMNERNQFYCNIQNLLYRLCFLNFTLSPYSAYPAPLQYAWKQSQMLQMFLSHDIKNYSPNYQNLANLGQNGYLYYL